MTTIAYRDGVMAADTMATWDSGRRDEATKLFRICDCVVGVAGNLFFARRWLEWFAGDREDEFDPGPFSFDEDEFGALILSPQGLLLVGQYAEILPVESAFYAIGSGADAALGAMRAGCSAVRAVEIAGEVDTGTGGRVISMSLEGSE